MDDGQPEEYLSSAASIVLSLWLSLCSIASVTGNAVVLWLFYKNESLRTVSNRFLASLSVADFLVGLVINPVWIAIRFFIEPPSPSVLHELTLMLWIYTTAATTFNICCVSVDRFIAIRFPFRYQDMVNKKRCYTVVILVWLLSLCLPFSKLSVTNAGDINRAIFWFSLTFLTFFFSISDSFIIIHLYFKSSKRTI